MTPFVSYISEICRLYVVVLLLASAAGKSFAFDEFEWTILDATHVSQSTARAIAVGIIAAEYLAALMSAIGGAFAQWGMVTALLLSVLFTAFITTMLVQGKAVRCNCFGGATTEMISRLDLVRNGVLAAFCAIYLLLGRDPVTSPSAAVTLLLLAVALIGLIFTANVKGIARILHES